MELNNWMKDINGNKKLLSINIPGTHDSVTKYVQFKKICTTQDLTIKEQLELGIRVLDIRVASLGNMLGMVHGSAKAFNDEKKKDRMKLGDVLEQCYSFLEENPSECIVFQFKNDSGKEMEHCFNILFDEYITGNEEKWFLENRIPTLDEARGKIYLIRRCKMDSKSEYTDKNTGLDFSSWVEQDKAIPEALTLYTDNKDDDAFIIQDRFKYGPIDKWNECINRFLGTAKEFDGRYVINYLSTAGGWKGPRYNAEIINRTFKQYPFEKGLYYGTIYIDFPDEELVKIIINLNE